MKEIPLTQGKVALVDDADYEWLMQWNWWVAWNAKSQTYYAMRTERDKGNRRSRIIIMARVITDAPKGTEVDHKDHDGLHNWRDNLRVCTPAQNAQNRRRRGDNTSGYKGVRRERSRWRANLVCNGMRHFLGYFETPEDAALAYNEAAVRLSGEFACLNGLP